MIPAITAILIIIWIAIRIIYKAFLLKEIFAAGGLRFLMLQLAIANPSCKSIVLYIDLVTIIDGVRVWNTIIPLLDHTNQAK